MKVDQEASFIYFIYPFLFKSGEFEKRVELIEKAQWKGRKKNVNAWQLKRFPDAELLRHVSVYLNPKGEEQEVKTDNKKEKKAPDKPDQKETKDPAQATGEQKPPEKPKVGKGEMETGKNEGSNEQMKQQITTDKEKPGDKQPKETDAVKNEKNKPGKQQVQDEEMKKGGTQVQDEQKAHRASKATARLWELNPDVRQSPVFGLRPPKEYKWTYYYPPKKGEEFHKTDFIIEDIQLALFRYGCGFVITKIKPLSDDVGVWLDFCHHFRFMGHMESARGILAQKLSGDSSRNKVFTPYFPAPQLVEDKAKAAEAKSKPTQGEQERNQAGSSAEIPQSQPQEQEASQSENPESATEQREKAGQTGKLRTSFIRKLREYVEMVKCLLRTGHLHQPTKGRPEGNQTGSSGEEASGEAPKVQSQPTQGGPDENQGGSSGETPKTQTEGHQEASQSENPESATAQRQEAGQTGKSRTSSIWKLREYVELVNCLLRTGLLPQEIEPWWEEVFIHDQMMPYLCLYVDEIEDKEIAPLRYRVRHFFSSHQEIYPSGADLADNNPSLLDYIKNIWFTFSLDGTAFFAANAPRTDFFRITLPDHVANHYFINYLICLHQRFALMSLSFQVAEHGLVGFEKTTPDQRLKIFRKIRDSLLELTTRGLFRDISHQDHHHRCYQRWQKELLVQEFFEEVWEEVNIMHSQVDTDNQRELQKIQEAEKRQGEELSRRINTLAVFLGAPVLGLTFLATCLAAVSIKGNLSFSGGIWLLLNPLAIFAVALSLLLGLLLIKGNNPLNLSPHFKGSAKWVTKLLRWISRPFRLRKPSAPCDGGTKLPGPPPPKN